MGKRGPKPKNARQQVEQSYQQTNEPSVSLRMPEGMGPTARAMWRKTCRDLKAAGRLLVVDEGDIEIASRAWDMLKMLDKAIVGVPLLVAGPNGAEYENPLFGMHLRAHKRWRDARRDLGLTAALRIRGGGSFAAADDPKDEMAKFEAERPNWKLAQG